ncbi:MAG: alpha/beta hydrolase [Nanoarchaeota archaeon]|nr:alpha/beta hydrolase [Nanoarchaeota archaeon]
MKKEQTLEKYLKCNDAEIYYKHSQPNSIDSTLVFLHGTTVNHTVFKESMDYFKNKGYGIIAIDQRGDGNSLPKSSDIDFYSLDNYTKDLESVIEKEEVKEPIIVGHSMGGLVAAEYASRNKKNIKSLVLIETSYNFKKTLTLGGKFFFLFSKSFRKYFTHLNNKARKKGIKPEYIDFSELADVSDKEFAKITYEKATPEYVQAMHALSNAVMRWDVEDKLKDVECSTLILYAEKSQFIRTETSYELKKKIGNNAEAKIIPDAKHQLTITHPEVINKEIDNFFSKIGL